MLSPTEKEPVALERTTTMHVMQQQMNKEAPVQLLTVLCFWWFPLLFVLGAGGVREDCEAENFKTWMMVFGVVPWAATSLSSLVATCFACCGRKFAFKMALRFHALISLLSVASLVWGCVEYAKTNEDCVADGANLDPRTLVLVLIVFSSVLLPCLLCAVYVLLRNMWSPTEVMVLHVDAHTNMNMNMKQTAITNMTLKQTPTTNTTLDVTPTTDMTLQRTNTTKMMKDGSSAGQLLALLCFWWFPMFLVLGAGGVREDCEAENFKTWMMVFGVVPWAAWVLISLIEMCLGYYGRRFAFKTALRVHALISLLSVALLLWGHVEYAKTTADCVHEDANLDPRTLVLVLLAVSGVLLPGLPCAVRGLLWKVWSPTAFEAAPPPKGAPGLRDGADPEAGTGSAAAVPPLIA